MAEPLECERGLVAVHHVRRPCIAVRHALCDRRGLLCAPAPAKGLRQPVERGGGRANLHEAAERLLRQFEVAGPEGADAQDAVHLRNLLLWQFLIAREASVVGLQGRKQFGVAL